MKSAVLVGLFFLAGAIAASAQSVPEDPPLPAGEPIPRMANPSIDPPGQPFSYMSRPTDQISVMHASSGTEITPEGYLYTGFGELMFFVGVERTPVSQRIKTLEDGYLPIVLYTVQHDGLEYRFTMFAASLSADPTIGPVVNFVRVEIQNHGTSSKNAFLTTAWRYQGPQSTPFYTGDNRFERPVSGKRIGDYQQPGSTFHADSRYTLHGNAYLRDGKAIYLFPVSPQPELEPTLHDYYNHVEPIGTPMKVLRTTPVATAEYEVAVPAGGSRTLDFKMPLVPVAPGGSKFEAIEKATFQQQHAKVRAFWNAVIARGIDIETPENKVNWTFKTSLVNTLMSLNKIGDHYVQTVNQLQYHAFYLRDTADFVRMYDISGYQEIAGHVLDFFASRQLPNGNFLSQPGQYDGWGEAMWAYGEHYRMTHDKAFAAAIYPRVVRAVDWLQKAIAADPLHLVPATDLRDNEFVTGHITGYNFLALDGLQATVTLAHGLNHPADAEHFQDVENKLRKSFLKRLDFVTAKTGGYIPPTLNGGTAGTDWGNLLALVPEQQLAPFDPRVTATLRATQAKYQEGLITYRQPDQGTYLHDYLTMKNTETELIRGEQAQAIREFYAELLHTSSTNGGFEYSIRPWGDRDFSGNLSPHGWYAADYRILLRNMLVREQGDTLHLLSAVSPEWIGKGKQIVVKRAPTYLGTVNLRLEMPSDTTATLFLSIDPGSEHPPARVLLHLPWFVDRDTVTAVSDGKPLPVDAGVISLPLNTRRVDLTWHRLSLPAAFPRSYQTAVEQYKLEYRKRFNKLTGVEGSR